MTARVRRRPPADWQERVLAAVGSNPDTTARDIARSIDCVHPFPDLVDAVLSAWARTEGGERDAGGGD